jgi:hypothetical protein
MKKIVIGVVAILSVSILNAQNLSVGPTAGFGHNWLTIDFEDDNLDNTFFPSYNVGAKLVYSFVSHWGISADVKFSSEGGSKKGMVSGEHHDYNHRLNYIRIPVQGIYFFGDLGDKVRPKIAVGPSFGFLVGGKTKLEVDEVDANVLNSKDLFEKFDVGLNASAGANFNIGNGRWLNTDITYYHGFKQIYQPPTDIDVHNRGLGINIGITFPLGTAK